MACRKRGRLGMDPVSSPPRSRLSYTLIRSRNNKNSWCCSTLVNSCASLSSICHIIAVPVPLPALNPCKTSWNWTNDLIHVSITSSPTFQTKSIITIHQVYTFTFVIITRKFHPSSVGMYPLYHMNWISSTSLSHRVGLGGTVEVSAVYASLRHVCRCSERRWVWMTELLLISCKTAASIYPSVGVSSSMPKGMTWVGIVRQGGDGPSHWYRAA